jgi:hypothetical protein
LKRDTAPEEKEAPKEEAKPKPEDKEVEENKPAEVKPHEPSEAEQKMKEQIDLLQAKIETLEKKKKRSDKFKALKSAQMKAYHKRKRDLEKKQTKEKSAKRKKSPVRTPTPPPRSPEQKRVQRPSIHPIQPPFMFGGRHPMRYGGLRF